MAGENQYISKFTLPNNEPYDLADEESRERAEKSETSISELYEANNGAGKRKDLAYTFADEIAQYDNVWAWLKARLAANDFSGICVGDVIPVYTTYEISTGNTFTFSAKVMGINTYRGFNGKINNVSFNVKNHIDFCGLRCFPVAHRYNMIDYNNGTANQQISWLASDLYLWLNSLSGVIPSDFEGGTTNVDYTNDGVYYYLPESLKNAITVKKAVLPLRHNNSGILSDDSDFTMESMGKLWLPTEIEVCGMPVWGGKTYCTTLNAIQYPLFASSIYNRVKYAGNSGDNSPIRKWWLLTANASTDKNKKSWCAINTSGTPSYANATDANYVPICFRIMAD